MRGDPAPVDTFTIIWLVPAWIPRVKLHLSMAAGRNLITAYGAGYVSVNHARHERSLIIMPERTIADWAPQSLAELQAAHFAPLLDLGLEVVLIGTGASLRFPPPQVLRPLMEARLGFEVMDFQAACRTYNILVDEDRKVAAALLLA